MLLEFLFLGLYFSRERLFPGFYLSKQRVPSAVGILGLLQNLGQLDLEIPVRLTRFLWHKNTETYSMNMY